MKIFKSILLSVLLIVLVLGIWSFIIEPRFLLDVQTHEVEVPNLDPEWKGKKVALLADFQVGMWLGNTDMVRKAVRKALEAKPAMVLIAGDFVYKPDSSVIKRAVLLLQPLVEAEVPVIAVMGNHDYSQMEESSEVNEGMAAYLMATLEESGIKVLENESVPLHTGNGATFHVVGLGSTWAGRCDVKKALRNIPSDEPRVIFMHNPIAFRDIPADEGLFTLAAHTHGGQIRLPLFPSESWLNIARPREVVADGWAADTIGNGGNRLYVSRGIGFSLIPMRLFCRPELTIFNLSPTQGTVPQPGRG